ncbi:MAG: AAA family ATPase [Calothrix sp. SM1_5_4]|nr:AAA family ATPase [Calothrix sp. SM1_5_4]
MDLFETLGPSLTNRPLAERLRPRDLEDFKGQAQVLKALRPYLKHPDRLPNIILWGPPGCGKTTLARLLAERSNSRFTNLNAVETAPKRSVRWVRKPTPTRFQGFGQPLFSLTKYIASIALNRMSFAFHGSGRFRSGSELRRRIRAMNSIRRC